jgi:hypothetical protein
VKVCEQTPLWTYRSAERPHRRTVPPSHQSPTWRRCPSAPRPGEHPGRNGRHGRGRTAGTLTAVAREAGPPRCGAVSAAVTSAGERMGRARYPRAGWRRRPEPSRAMSAPTSLHGGEGVHVDRSPSRAVTAARLAGATGKISQCRTVRHGVPGHLWMVSARHSLCGCRAVTRSSVCPLPGRRRPG